MKLYRAYYQDYRNFLARPDAVAKPAATQANSNTVFVVHADLRQFYDRVRPQVLADALESVRRPNDDPAYFDLARSVLNWSWDPRDESEVTSYSLQAGLSDFTQVTLPQGLVASGFFANLVLLSFDTKLKETIGKEIDTGVTVLDACRYVDDLRITITARHQPADVLKQTLSTWLHDLLAREAPGLELSEEKTLVAPVGGDEHPPIRQSARMNRIQGAVSGGFDAQGAESILDAIHGLMGVQDELNKAQDTGWRMTPVPDVSAGTVSRFAAVRFRTTVRSLRPLLDDPSSDDPQNSNPAVSYMATTRKVRTQRDLDEDTRTFALDLIQRWVHDPSNVRLLRIGLDLWPDAEVLREVLALLRPFTEKGGRRKAPRRVAWYCLSEILRAGATETGLAMEGECLPVGADLPSYRMTLRDEAIRLLQQPTQTIPWYLRQQALLFLAAVAPSSAPFVHTGTNPETRHYRQLIRFLRGDTSPVENREFATLAVLARRAFADQRRAHELASPNIDSARARYIAQKDPSFLLELLATEEWLLDGLPARIREDLSTARPRPEDARSTLADLVTHEHPNGVLRNELSLLRFAVLFLHELRTNGPIPDVIVPSQVQIELTDSNGIAKIDNLRILASRTSPSGSLYRPPLWCKDENCWRFQLGFLLRFALSGQPDFTRPVRPPHWKENESVYRPPESHWYQRLYGLFSGQPAFGDDWLPITDWMELFLLALLRWPGCRVPFDFDWVEHGIDQAIAKISNRVVELEKRLGPATGTLHLPMIAKRPTPETAIRELRACVVQTVIPMPTDFEGDLQLNDPAIRKKHRNHLSTALAAIERMLALRGTHKVEGNKLDWLILPELAVHPDDVRTHLIPFARFHRTIVLAGLTYDRINSGLPLVNSALWIIPEWTNNYGLQIKTRRQGKAHLAPDEQKLNGKSPTVPGFRPCQWLIGYPWSSNTIADPVWLSGVVCYDATDLGLAADLREQSDILAIPALNKDVSTFDQMALALHYHMFQMVIVANNGGYGGSNAYWPKRDAHVRQIFHIHGQPQASVAFLEINDIAEFLLRQNKAISGTGDWKFPPAGLSTRVP